METVLDEIKRKEIVEEILSKSNFGNGKIGKFLGLKVPEKYENLKMIFDSQKSIGALYIADEEMIIQVVDIGVFQVIVS